MKFDLNEMFPARKAQMEAIVKAGGMCTQCNDGYGCTEPVGHTGPHIAHSNLGSKLHTWEREEGK